MSDKITSIIAIVLLFFVAVLTITSMVDDSLTMDEVSHLPAGYSYLTQKDMRLNPEHPPLIKNLSAIPLLFIKNITFPSEIKEWKEDINGQWGFGFNFLYHSGNPADLMIFWGRIPMILVLLLLGFYLFKWTKELFGNKTALMSLFLFSFSPTFLAHGRLVATDVGATFGIFTATYYFIKYLQTPSNKNLIIAGLFLGIAQLMKFSVILLLPFFGILIFVWSIIKSSNFKNFLKLFGSRILAFILITLIAFILIWGVYLYHVWNYPPERQVRDTEFLLRYTPFPNAREILIWASTNPILRPLAQYFLGLVMVFERATGGHTTYFLGEISTTGWKGYFPFVYLTKEPLVVHVLTTIVIIFYIIWLIKKLFWQNTFSRLNNWLKNHFSEFAMFTFLIIYWTVSLKSTLNIGVRHLLPTFPFVYILISIGIISILKPPYLKIKYSLLVILLIWQAISVLSVYPHFLAYFNEIVGGTEKGHIYVVDSNLDWGQDLKRLKKWVDDKKIDKIYLDYFGGGDPQYYLKQKFEQWHGNFNPEKIPKNSYLAVSVSFLQKGRGIPASGFNQPTDFYLWLNQYEPPVAKIGHSIFVYYIP